MRKVFVEFMIEFIKEMNPIWTEDEVFPGQSYKPCPYSNKPHTDVITKTIDDCDTDEEILIESNDYLQEPSTNLESEQHITANTIVDSTTTDVIDKECTVSPALNESDKSAEASNDDVFVDDAQDDTIGKNAAETQTKYQHIVI